MPVGERAVRLDAAHDAHQKRGLPGERAHRGGHGARRNPGEITKQGPAVETPRAEALLSDSYPTALAIGAVLAFLAPATVWLYTEFRSRWRERLKADFELLKVCREAETGRSSFSDLREKLEQSIARRSNN